MPDADAALLRVSQALLDETVQFKVPLPLLLIESVWELGAVPFWILFVLPPDVAAAVFDEGDIAPINAAEGDAGGVVVDWPVSVSGMGDGTLTASCDEVFVTPVSFDRDEGLSVDGAKTWPVVIGPDGGDMSVDGPGATNEAVVPGFDRRISLWDFF